MSSKLNSVADFINIFGIIINLIQFFVIVILAWSNKTYTESGETEEASCEIRYDIQDAFHNCNLL